MSHFKRSFQPTFGIYLFPFTFILAALCLLLAPGPLLADVQINVASLESRSGIGVQKSTFMPGETIRYQTVINTLPGSSLPFKVLLRVAGDGWYETHEQEIIGLGLRTITWGGIADPLYTSTDVCEGKVSLYLDVIAGEGENVAVQGRRHSYMTVECPSGRPAGIVTASLEVGELPFDMALTRNGRYLYVTSRESRNISVIDTELAELVTTIPADWDEVMERVRACQDQCPDQACRRECSERIEPVGEPSGVAASPDGTQMLVADYRRPVVHLVNAQSHEIEGEISLEAFKPMRLVDLVVNPNFNEFYVLDYTDVRIFRMGLNPPHPVTEIRIESPFLPEGMGLFSTRIVMDPILSNQLYILSGIIIRVTRTGNFLGFWPLNAPVPSWDMVFDIGAGSRVAYVVLSPFPVPTTFPFDHHSFISRLDFNFFPIESEVFEVGSNIGDLALRNDGRYAYAIDSYRSEILLVDLERVAELKGCAIPVQGGTGGRNMLADPGRNRLYVGTWAPGAVLFVE